MCAEQSEEADFLRLDFFVGNIKIIKFLIINIRKKRQKTFRQTYKKELDIKQKIILRRSYYDKKKQHGFLH